MSQVRWLYAGLCALALATPATAQSGQYENRDRRESGYDRGRDGGYDRDGRDGRYGGSERDDRRGNDRWGNGRPGASQPLPGGSWAQSCRRQTMSGYTLNAQCRDQRGKWRDTQINTRQCRTGRVGNRFGTLACE